MNTDLDHLAHPLVFGLFTFPLEFSSGNITVLNRLFHPLKRHRNGPSVAVIQCVEKVDPFDGATASRAKVPTHQLARKRPLITFLNACLGSASLN